MDMPQAKMANDKQPAPQPKPQPTPGQPLPRGFKNPPCGTPGHYCLDLKGNYNPEWVQVKIQKRDSQQAERQVFGCRALKRDPETKLPKVVGGRWSVQTDVWADAPPYVLAALQECKIPVTQFVRDPELEIMTGFGKRMVIREEERFAFSWLPSK
jgi:hypothetical protein